MRERENYQRKRSRRGSGSLTVEGERHWKERVSAREGAGESLVRIGLTCRDQLNSGSVHLSMHYILYSV